MNARAIAVVQTSAYDAWACYDPVAQGTRLGSTLRRPAGERTSGNKERAISYAAYRALVDLYPAQRADFDARMATLGYDPSDTSTDVITATGIGNRCAQALLAFRHTDGSNQLNNYADTTGYVTVNGPDSVVDPSKWQQIRFPNGNVPTYIGPHWGNVIPFSLPSSSALRPPAPPEFASTEYLRQMNEVIVLTQNLTSAQRLLVEYWFFTLGNALMDAGIGCWECKRFFNTSRPITAIRVLSPGNENWLPSQAPDFLTPPFPEYTSGHSTFSTAAAEVLQRFTGSDDFVYDTGRLVPLAGRWTTFSAAAEQAGISRRYGGIHFEAGDREGRKMGQRIGGSSGIRHKTTFLVDKQRKRKACSMEIYLERRRFLFLAAVIPLATLVGCGGVSLIESTGGGDGINVPIPVDRTTISGNLRQQFELFNTANFRLGSTWQGTSPALVALAGLQTRALPGIKAPLQATAIGLDGARVAFERLCNQTLSLDDLGYVAGAVTSGSSLQGSTNLNNPTWLAGMFAQNVASLQVVGAIYSIFQIGGLGELRAWVLSRPDEIAAFIAYAVAAELFNSCVDALCAAAGTPALAQWKLDVSAELSVGNIPTQLDRLLPIVLALPFGPGSRAGAGTDDASLGAGQGNFAASLLGTFVRQLFVGATLDSLDPAAAHYDLTTRLTGMGILQTLRALPGGLTSAQGSVDSWLSSSAPRDWPGGDVAAINCQIQIISTSYNFFNALRASIMESQSALGAIVLGDQAVAAFDAMDAAMLSCGSVYQKALWERQVCARTLLRSFRFTNGSLVTERKIPEVSIIGLEFDQVAFASINRIKVTLCIEVEIDQGAGKARGLSVAASRALLAGQTSAALPRTFAAVGNAAANLLAELTERFRVELVGDWKEDGMFSFIPSNFTSFVRREPGSPFATIPSISQAALLCAGPGFLPSRSAGLMDLTTLMELPTLSTLTNLVGGVPIHVN